jgi:hypothetical protein
MLKVSVEASNGWIQGQSYERQMSGMGRKREILSLPQVDPESRSRWKGRVVGETTFDIEPLMTSFSTVVGLNSVRRSLPSSAASAEMGSEAGKDVFCSDSSWPRL